MSEKRPFCLLSGLQGAGKSTLAPLVAAFSGMPWVDLDERTAEPYSSSREAFITIGEEAFRMRERECLEEISSGEACVIALGGGTLEAPDLRFPEPYVCIYLELELEQFRNILQRRIEQVGCPPYLDTHCPRAIETLYYHRLSQLEYSATAVIRAHSATPEQLASEIATVYRSYAHGE